MAQHVRPLPLLAGIVVVNMLVVAAAGVFGDAAPPCNQHAWAVGLCNQNFACPVTCPVAPPDCGNDPGNYACNSNTWFCDGSADPNTFCSFTGPLAVCYVQTACFQWKPNTKCFNYGGFSCEVYYQNLANYTKNCNPPGGGA